MMSNSKRRLGRSMGGRFAAVVIFLLSAGSLQGQTKAVRGARNPAEAGPNRPASVPAGYWITPFGYFHPSCVRSVEDGETLLADGRVRHANGNVDARAPVCGHPQYTRTGLIVPPDMKGETERRNPAINGWLESIQTITDTSYGKLSATWTVPPAPTNPQNGQTLFFFPGFEATVEWLSILQPVLQWYPHGPWQMSSWNCCMQGTVWHSVPKKVSPGDTLLGTITPTCKPGSNYCETWTIVTKDLTTGKKSVLKKTPSEGQVWNWAFAGVAEVYGVRECGDFPANHGVVFTVQLYDQNRQLIADPGWFPHAADPDTDPSCSYGLDITPTVETVSY